MAAESRAPLEFPPRVDRWIVVVVLASLALTLGTAVALLLEGDWLWALSSLAIVAGLALVIYALAWPVRYAVDDDGIVVHAGRQRVVIGWAELVSAEAVWSPLASSAAWSMQRVRLVSTRVVMLDIAPRDREGFLREVAERSPRHALREGKIVVAAD